MSASDAVVGRQSDAARRSGGALQLFHWSDPPVIALALVALAAGFGQFGAVAALGDVGRSFGRITHGATLSDQAGLSGTELGIGLAVLRLAALAGLPLAGLADRFGRRRLLLLACAVGLGLTATAALSPGYWWFVALFALGRPALSAATALAQVDAAEQTGSAQRTKAVALVAAGYGVGAGLTAVIHGAASAQLGFRGLFALSLIPLAVVAIFRNRVQESDRFARAAATDRAVPVLGAVGRPFRRRMLIVCALAFAVSVITGPANSFLFLYSQDFLHLSGPVTVSMVIAAGLAGLVGLIAGQRLADHWGRRPTGALAMIGLAGGGVLAYSGPRPALFAGYVLGVLAGSVFAPAAGALANELFPTSVRASVAGWLIAAGVLGAVCGLLVFGRVADVGSRFASAAAVTFLPMVALAALFWLLPETKGLEPESLWPSEGVPA